MKIEKINKIGYYTYYKSLYKGKVILFRKNDKNGKAEVKFTNALAQGFGYKDKEEMINKEESMRNAFIASGSTPRWMAIEDGLGEFSIEIDK